MWLYIALGLVALALYVFKSCKYDYWEKKGIPTASGNEWFFGHFKPLILVKKHMNEVIDDIYKEYPNAPLVGYYVMGQPGLLVQDLDMIKTILVSEFSSFNSNGFEIDKKADRLASAHPFVLKGDEWKSARAQVTPSLSLVKLKGYLPSVLKVGDEMVKYVKKNCIGATEVDVQDLARMYCTDVIGNAIYGIENNTFENGDSLISCITREIRFERDVSDNILLFFQRCPVIRSFYPARFTSPKLQDVVVTVTRKVIKERIASGEKRNDLIQLLLTQKESDSQGVFTDEYMSAQVFTIIGDLYDSASNFISIILAILSRHPEIQEKLRSEIKEVKSRNNGDFTVEDIEGAKYLEMVFNETFRLFSFFIPRQCNSDCTIPVPGSEPIRITKGTQIAIPACSIHKDPKYYPDPERFDPERFSEEEVAKRPKFTYMPFGEGPKKCIGNRIVTLHIKAAIIKILDNFKLTFSTKTKYPFEIDPRHTFTIRPKGDVWVTFDPIH
ncbi:cytochrome P450 6j1-like isoform X1 [Cydia fagiglandana]|uniref:cytochrome P450 6j1-like isoform X1 n=1 Tax=Cydia fagiglandana TaxID=1458189 RepID=UPI002FEE0EDF